jgi:hypothetical protein
MILDPGALGTLIIGLESVRLDAERPAHRRDRSTNVSKPAGAPIRLRLAGALRAVAGRLEPRPADR